MDYLEIRGLPCGFNIPPPMATTSVCPCKFNIPPPVSNHKGLPLKI